MSKSVSYSYNGPTADGVTQRYDYDALGRLEQVICPQNSLLNEEYRYDASGNIVTKAVGASKVEFSYDLANQLVSRSDNTEFIHYAYDKAGRLTNEVDQNNQSLATYSYGYLDKVMSVQRQEAIAPVTFAYDASGMLVGKQKAGQTTAYQWDGIALAAKGNTLFANEDHVCGGAVLAENKLEDSASASPEYLLSDYLGTTVTPLEDKTLSDQEKFSRAKLSFGKEASADASERFTGKPYDEDLQAYVFPFRNYRADLCRWTSTDPSGFPDGENNLAYAPVPNSRFDKLGLQQGTIDSLNDGLIHWADNTGSAASVGPNTLSDVTSCSGFQELISRIQDQRLTPALQAVDQTMTDGELTAYTSPGYVDIGFVDVLLGRSRISYDDTTAWHASNWTTDDSGQWYRIITGTTTMNLSVSDNFDFTWNPNDSFVANLIEEAIPGWIAGTGTGFEEFGSTTHTYEGGVFFLVKTRRLRKDVPPL